MIYMVCVCVCVCVRACACVFVCYQMLFRIQDDWNQIVFSIQGEKYGVFSIQGVK